MESINRLKHFFIDDCFKYFLVFISIVIYVSNVTVFYQWLNWLPILMKTLNLLLLMYVIFFCNLDHKDIPFISITMIMLAFSQFLNRDLNMVVGLLLIIICKGLVSEKVVKCSLAALVVSVSFIFILYNLGYGSNWGNEVNGVMYSAFGFTHRTIFPSFLISIAMGIIYLDFRCNHFFINSLILVLFIWISMTLSHVRTAGIIIFLMLIFNFLNYIRKFKTFSFLNVVIKFFLNHMILWIGLLFIFTFVTTVLYNVNIPVLKLFLDKLDVFFTGRLYLQKCAFDLYAIPLTPSGYLHNLKTFNCNLFLDNGLMHGIYMYGLIPVIYLLYVYASKAKRAFRLNDWRYSVLLLFILIESVTFPNMYYFVYTPFILLALTKETNYDL